MSGINNLQIVNVNLEDDGIYQCQIGRTVEAREVLSNFANLTILIPPDQISLTYVPPGIAISGKEFQLNCEVFNTRPAPTFTWQTPPHTHIVNISQLTQPMTPDSKLLKSTSTITLIVDINQHGQEIKCEAMHVALNKSLIGTTTIAVDCRYVLRRLDCSIDSSLDQPVVKITLKPTKMYENKDYWFECIAEARPPITELVYVFE